MSAMKKIPPSTPLRILTHPPQEKSPLPPLQILFAKTLLERKTKQMKGHSLIQECKSNLTKISVSQVKQKADIILQRTTRRLCNLLKITNVAFVKSPSHALFLRGNILFQYKTMFSLLMLAASSC